MNREHMTEIQKIINHRRRDPGELEETFGHWADQDLVDPAPTMKVWMMLAAERMVLVLMTPHL